MKKLLITINGTAGTGKSVVSRKLAETLRALGANVNIIDNDDATNETARMIDSHLLDIMPDLDIVIKTKQLTRLAASQEIVVNYKKP